MSDSSPKLTNREIKTVQRILSRRWKIGVNLLVVSLLSIAILSLLASTIVAVHIWSLVQQLESLEAPCANGVYQIREPTTQEMMSDVSALLHMSLAMERVLKDMVLGSVCAGLFGGMFFSFMMVRIGKQYGMIIRKIWSQQRNES